MWLCVSRESSTVPAKAHIAVSRYEGHQQVAVTLQDASVGATAIMRIIALCDDSGQSAAAAGNVAESSYSGAISIDEPGTASAGHAPLAQPKQFSLHIMRCNCILRAAASRRVSKVRQFAAQPALVLNVPDFSLQLPPSRPCALLMPLPSDLDQLDQAGRMHFSAGPASRVVSCASISLALVSMDQEPGGQPLLSVPSASAIVHPAHSSAGRQTADGSLLAVHVPTISSHITTKEARLLAALASHGMHDWLRFSKLSDDQSVRVAISRSTARAHSPSASRTLQIRLKADLVTVRLLPQPERHALDLACHELALDCSFQQGKMHGHVAFSKLQLEYGLSSSEDEPEAEEHVRSSSPQDEFRQPLGLELSRTFSAPLGNDPPELERHRHSKRLMRRNSRDGAMSLTPRVRSGPLDASGLAGITTSSSHSGSFSNIPGLKPSREQPTSESQWPMAGLVSRRAILPGMIRAPSRLNKWLQQLPASHEEPHSGHGLTAAFYGAGSSSGSIGDVTEILDPADLEQESAMSIWDAAEPAALQEGPGFDHVMLLSIDGNLHQKPRISFTSSKLSDGRQLELNACVHATVFAEVINCSSLASGQFILISCCDANAHVCTLH